MMTMTGRSMKFAGAVENRSRGQHAVARNLRATVSRVIPRMAAAVICATAPAAGSAASQDFSSPRVSVEYDEHADAARVTASIDIPAAPQIVYQVMLDCTRALRIVTGLESCRVTETSGDGKWDIREHIISIGMLLPRVRNVFKSEYQPFQQIRFHRIDGDLRASEGEWLLQPFAGGTATRVIYQSRLAFFWPVPRFLMQEAIRRDIPGVLVALRKESLARAAP